MSSSQENGKNVFSIQLSPQALKRLDEVSEGMGYTPFETISFALSLLDVIDKKLKEPDTVLCIFNKRLKQRQEIIIPTKEKANLIIFPSRQETEDED